MDELDKKSEKGLEYFKRKGDIGEVKSSLDGMVDGMFDVDPNEPNESSGDEVKKSKMKWIWMAIAILLLFLLFYQGFKDGGASKIKHDTPEALFAQYFEPMDDLTTDVSRGESSGNAGVSGMELYNQKEYAKAATVLLASDDVESQFYGAISLLNGGVAEESLLLMDEQLASPNYSKYHDIIRWYRALALMKLGDLENAKTQLNQIIEADGYKSKEAKKILFNL